MRVTWLNFKASGPPALGPFWVMVASKIPPPCPDAVLRLIWLKIRLRMPPLTAAALTGARLLLAIPPLPWSPALSAGAVLPVTRLPLMAITPWLRMPPPAAPGNGVALDLAAGDGRRAAPPPNPVLRPTWYS